MTMRGCRIALWATLGLATGGLAACGSGAGNEVPAGAESDVAAEPSHVTEQNGEAGVTLDSVTRARIGLKTVRLIRTERNRETELPGEVVANPEGPTVIRSGVGGRLSLPAGKAWPRFGQWIRTGDTIGVVGDGIPLTAPASGSVSRVLARPGEILPPGAELLELTDFESPVVRLTWPEDGGTPPRTLNVSIGDGPEHRATLVGAAPQADALTRTEAWLYRVAGPVRGIRPGLAVTGYLPERGGLRRGILIPADAVVQWDALAWAYVQRTPGFFVRVPVPTDAPVRGGWLVARGFAAGDSVVTTGAGQLLSEEFRARIIVGEEVGE